MRINFSENQDLFGISQSINKKEKASNFSFTELLNTNMNKVNQLLMESEETNDKLALGQIYNLHQAVITTQKAELALQYTMQIRNKILDAYHEIMRMTV